MAKDIDYPSPFLLWGMKINLGNSANLIKNNAVAKK